MYYKSLTWLFRPFWRGFPYFSPPFEGALGGLVVINCSVRCSLSSLVVTETPCCWKTVGNKKGSKMGKSSSPPIQCLGSKNSEKLHRFFQSFNPLRYTAPETHFFRSFFSEEVISKGSFIVLQASICRCDLLVSGRVSNYQQTKIRLGSFSEMREGRDPKNDRAPVILINFIDNQNMLKLSINKYLAFLLRAFCWCFGGNCEKVTSNHRWSLDDQPTNRWGIKLGHSTNISFGGCMWKK